MSQTFGIEAPDPARAGAPHRAPVRYLVLLDPSDQATALLFTAERCPAGEFAAGSEEVAAMVGGRTAQVGAEASEWSEALAQYSDDQRRAARVYVLDV